MRPTERLSVVELWTTDRPRIIERRRPTVADLVEHLSADPDLAASVFAEVKVAGPWVVLYEGDDEGDDIESLVRPSFGTVVAAEVELATEWVNCGHCGERTRGPVRWRWAILNGAESGYVDTQAEAIAAADAALVEVGWKLAGGTP